MSFAVVANIVTALLCTAVLVQSVRMMRALRSLKEGALGEVVGALDGATAQARAVLAELKTALRDCAGAERAARDGKAMADELGVMIGISDASAERLVEAAAAANRQLGEAWSNVSDYVDVGDAEDGDVADQAVAA